LCDFRQIYIRACLVLLIFRLFLLNDSMTRIFFTQMMLFGLSVGFPSSQILKELLPTFTEISYHLFPARRMFSFFQLIKSKI